MNLQTIAEHTVDLSLITRDSKVLDLGCRNFGFAKAMMEYVDGIICVDGDERIDDPDDDRINLIHGVVCSPEEKRTLVPFVVYGNGTGNYIYDGRRLPKGADVYNVLPITLNEIILHAGKPDLIKFDIEGSEIPVLLALKEPPAKQLSIEFHIHTGTTKYQIEDVYKHLKSLGYERVFEDWSDKHGCGYNLWDVLFIKR